MLANKIFDKLSKQIIMRFFKFNKFYLSLMLQSSCKLPNTKQFLNMPGQHSYYRNQLS